MKKPSYLYHQRNVQTNQQQRYRNKIDQQRNDRLKDYQINQINTNNVNINNQHYRKHNSPDAQKLRSYQQQVQQGQGFFGSQNSHRQQIDGQRSKMMTRNQHQQQQQQQQQQQNQQKQDNKRQRTLGQQQNSNNYQSTSSLNTGSYITTKQSENQQQQQRPILSKTASSPKLLLNFNQTSDNNHSKPEKIYTETDEYQKLHQKLNSIQDKIMNMKKNIQRKREQKQKMLQKQKKQKLQQQQRQKQRQKQKQRARSSQNSNLKSTTKPSPSSNPLKGLVTQVPQHKQLHTFQRNPYSPRHNIYYVSQIIRAYLDEKSLARQHLLTSLHILRILQRSELPSDQEMKRRRVDLQMKKQKQGKKCVVFDLDQTLIHCNDSLTPPHDVKLPIKFPTGEIIQAGINIRPYAKQILKNLAKNFQVIVFTASHSCYANVVLDYLDPNDQYIDHRLFREHCYQTAQGMYVKDLRVMNRDLKDVVLVDNAAYSYAFQLDNGIPILPYYHGSQDYQLNTLEKYLNEMIGVNDVRDVNRKTFGLYKYRQYYNEPERLVEEMYINEEIQVNNKKK